jgi:5-(carboxyamino)imidazole ribonucleotide mutase
MSRDFQNDPKFKKLPPHLKSLVMSRMLAIQEINAGDNVTAGVAAIARRYNSAHGWGKGTIRNLYYSFMKNQDWQVLLEKRKAGPDFWQTLEEPALPLKFRELLGTFWSQRQRGKFRAAYVKLKAQYKRWQAGHESAAIPGYEHCPDPRPDTRLPDGWSEGNLRRVAKKHATSAAQPEFAEKTQPSIMAEAKTRPLVGIIMGSQSDWETMQHAAKQLAELGVPHEVQVISAHRTPDLVFDYAAGAAGRGLEVIIAGAGGAAHLAGVAAAKTCLPVLGVPMESPSLGGLDSLLSMAQMPGGVPVGTLAIGKAGAINAALLATAILGNAHPQFRRAYEKFRAQQTERGAANRQIKAG